MVSWCWRSRGGFGPCQKHDRARRDSPGGRADTGYIAGRSRGGSTSLRAVTRLGFSAAVAVWLLALGCGGGSSSDPVRGQTPPPVSRSGSRPPLCTPLRTRVTGRVTTPAAIELSGLALSRAQARVLWTHNDSGDRARILAVAESGRLRADLTVTGAEHVDWEDIAIGSAGQAGDALYIGDIGDNLAARSAVVVYRIPEPRLAGGAPSATAPALPLTLRYPDGPRDAEALLVDPSSGALVIVTKDFGGNARVYVADHAAANATTTLRRAGQVSLGTGAAVTAGDVSANGSTIALRTYGRAFVWSRRRREPLASALRRKPCAARADLGAEGQAEALALSRDGRAFHTVPEGERPALRRYTPVTHIHRPQR